MKNLKCMHLSAYLLALGFGGRAIDRSVQDCQGLIGGRRAGL